MIEKNVKEYKYSNSLPTWSNYYIWPELVNILKELNISDKRLFEMGCGNGATAKMLSKLGYDVTGIDISKSGIISANKTFPDLKLSNANVYDDLASEFGNFPVVISLEVIEHCYYPRKFVKSFYDLIEVGGHGIISTPFHGYWKNLAIALFGKWDQHFNPLWDEGHIKFFSYKTFYKILTESGFKNIKFKRVGRIPPIAKSMLAIVEK